MSEPFDAGRDADLGRLLRRALTPGDDAAFAARIVARLPDRAGLRDELARWARPGVAAAVLLAALGGYWLGLRQAETADAEPAPELAATERPLSGDELLEVTLGLTR
jgi:hypothetical protein